jgi:FkbM family methyltransferase
MLLRAFSAKCVRLLIGRNRYIRLRMDRQQEYSFPRQVHGVIHVVASEGQERDLYAAFGLQVIWIEPIQEVHDMLVANIRRLPSQRALNYLIAEEDGKGYEFHIVSNSGESPSTLALGKVTNAWPELRYTRTIMLTAVTLATTLKREPIDLADYDALVLDTQGSECRILTGASELLSEFRFIKTEVPDFEGYIGCCQIEEISQLMPSYGFHEGNSKIRARCWNLF